MSYIGTEPKDIRSFGRTKFDYTATQGQTAFTGADDDGKVLAFTVGQIEVYVNGILMDDSDFTTTGTGTVTLASAANLNDVVNVVSFESNIPDNDYVPASGGTFTGAVTHTGAFTSKGIDDNADATAITIDSSENVMVGTTSTSFSTAGTVLYGANGTQMVRSGQPPLNLNRTSSDGNITEFYKDGTSVGSIGSEGGDALYIQSGTTSGTGRLFTGNGTAIRPARNGVTVHNTLDLGSDTRSFKDLYLSGGAYIGGTGAANHLDDYETGTFQMTMTGKTGGAVGHGQYVKIGNICHFSWYSATQSITSSVAGVLGGLPFTHISPNNSAYAAVTLAHNTWVSNASTGYINIGTNSIYPTANNSSTASNTSTGSKYVMCSGSYTVG